MKDHWRIPVRGLASAVLCSLSIWALPARADLMWGVNGHPFTAYPGIGIERQLDYLRDLGVRSYRVNVTGADTAERLAELVAAARQRSIDILPVLTPAGLDLDKSAPDELYAGARRLALALGTRFKSDIRVWELGNEMENYAIIQPCEQRDDGTQYPCSWGPAGGVEALEYYGPRWVKVSAVLKGLSDGMTEADPTIRKAMGTAGWGHTGAFERMRKDGIAWDITVWHMYGEDPEWAFEKLARYDRPIWVTEFNNPYGSQRSEQQQAEGLKWAMSRLRQMQRKYRIEAAHIYELMDEPYWTPSFEAVMGLVRVTGSAEKGWWPGEPKPAYAMVRDLIRGPRPPALPSRDCDLKAIRTVEPIARRQASFGYCLVLGRSDGGDDMARWAGALESGEASYFDMAIALLRSDEFSARYTPFSMSDRAYVGFLYRLLMMRDGDAYGVESYARQLRAGTMAREDVAIGMMTSSEFTFKFAVQLGRDTSVTGAVPPG